MTELLQFLIDLSKESNFKIVISGLNLIDHLCKNSVLKHSDMEKLLPSIINKLGDNKIAIRQGAFKILSTLLENNSPIIIFTHLIKDFYNTNWHIREEVVTVIIASMLRNVRYNYLELIPHLAKLLDDEKTKVRHVTTESLAVISNICGQNEVIAELEPIIASTALKQLSERFRHPILPQIVDNTVQFPRAIPSSAPTISSPYITNSSPFPKPKDLIDLKIYKSIMNEELLSQTPNIENTEYLLKDIQQRNSRIFMEKNKSGFMRPPTIPINVNKGTPLINNKLGRESHSPFLNIAELSPTKKENKKFEEVEAQIYLTEYELQPLPNPNEVLSNCISVPDD